MRSFFCFVLFLGISLSCCSQNGLDFLNNKKKVSVPFLFINNLIILPGQVNGVTLNFLIDTGVEDSILFSLEATNRIQFENIEQIRIQGFGNNESFNALKSNGNTLSLKNLEDKNHTFYLVLNQEINISTQIGTPVNGILGYHFFKNHFVKIDYKKQRIIFLKKTEKSKYKIQKNYQKIPLEIYKGKPYFFANVKTIDSVKSTSLKFLIDNGNSDAIWLLSKTNTNIVISENNFKDFLGKGFGGDVYGKRARINNFEIANFNFNNALVSFPETDSNLVFDSIIKRNGSIGSEILRRFTVVFDYSNSYMYLKKNSLFYEPFNFNMSGIEVEHQGLEYVSNSFRELSLGNNNYFNGSGERVFDNIKYEIQLKPIYIISNVREDSPAEAAGLQKGDKILKINRKKAYNFKLQDINNLLKSEEGKTITFEIERNNKEISVNFVLKSRI